MLYMGTGGNEDMAKAGQDRPLKAVEPPQSDDLSLDEAKVVIGNLTQQNEALKGALRAVGADCMALRDFCNKVAG